MHVHLKQLIQGKWQSRDVQTVYYDDGIETDRYSDEESKGETYEFTENGDFTVASAKGDFEFSGTWTINDTHTQLILTPTDGQPLLWDIKQLSENQLKASYAHTTHIVDQVRRMEVTIAFVK
jgi:hypothetical protein